ncbi:hypothetical protein PG996_014767 [Apiospora saccharicola]|uniref:Uncharacterized protein n=1 Tax=Apiospora saccharicola TaxID=335842 RepID=A0ABR1TJ87_9PEZI
MKGLHSLIFAYLCGQIAAAATAVTARAPTVALNDKLPVETETASQAHPCDDCKECLKEADEHEDPVPYIEECVERYCKTCAKNPKEYGDAD